MKNNKKSIIWISTLLAAATVYCSGSAQIGTDTPTGSSPSTTKTLSSGTTTAITVENLSFSMRINQITATTAVLTIGAVDLTLAVSSTMEVLHQPGLEITLISTKPSENSAEFSFGYRAPTDIEIVGEFTDNYDYGHTITKTTWENSGCVKTIISFDNVSKSLIYQEASSAPCYNPNKFGKIYWSQVQSNGKFYQCENVYNKNSAAEAMNDPSPPSKVNLPNGCGGFSWSLMAKNNLQIIGNFTDNYSGTYVIAQMSWENYGCVKTIISYDNAARSLIYQEAMNAACYNQGKFGKIYWTQVQGNGSFYHCENVYGKSTPAAAASDASPPAPANLTTGCGSFAWSSMTRNNLQIIGSYTDNYAGTHAITQTSWTNYGCPKTIVGYDNNARTFIYQEAMNAACYNQGKFGKVYWTVVQGNGNFNYCENVYAKDSAADASKDSNPPATGNLATGCGGFSWSGMTKN